MQGSTYGATKILPDDRYPFKVEKRTEKTATLIEVEQVSTKTGHAPAFWRGPYSVWDHIYSDDELDRLALPDQPRVTVRLHKDGRWYDPEGIPYTLDLARFYRDYSS